jgi:hypothetical protein
VIAVFSTFGVVDKDGDVTLPDAFTDGEQVSISAYNHTSWGGVLPVGKGTIRTTKDGAVLEGQFFMDTQLGRETFQVVKNMGGQQEWSYGFDVVKHSFGEFEGKQVRFLEQLKVTEVSPVLLGAGENTRTLAVKSRKTTGEGPVDFKRAIRPHKSATTARPWDEYAVTEAIGDGASVSDLRSVYAWADGDPELKASYRFPHHHGVDGPANIRALITGIAVLNGAKGAWSGPEEDRQAIYQHLAQHLKDADREPPELRAPGGELTLHEEAIQALEGVKAYLESAKRVVALRAQKGKSLSQVNTEALDWVGEDLRGLLKEHSALMSTLHNTPREAAAEQFVRFLATQRRA